MALILKLIAIMTLTSNLHQEKVIALPIAVETHALATEWNDDLWVLINQPGEHQTALLKVTPDYTVTLVGKVPTLASSSALCGEELIISGSDSVGNVVILAINSSGSILWQHSPDINKPTTWPEVTCDTHPLIAWQDKPASVQWGVLNPANGSLERWPENKVGQPPAKLYAWRETLLAAWAEMGELHILDLRKGSEQVVPVDEGRVADFSVARSKNGIYYGWTAAGKAYWMLPPSTTFYPLPHDSHGTFNLISGGPPLVWVQESEDDIDENLNWKSTLIPADSHPHSVSGYVFAVTWWQQKVALVQQSNIILLKK